MPTTLNTRRENVDFRGPKATLNSVFPGQDVPAKAPSTKEEMLMLMIDGKEAQDQRFYKAMRSLITGIEDDQAMVIQDQVDKKVSSLESQIADLKSQVAALTSNLVTALSVINRAHQEAFPAPKDEKTLRVKPEITRGKLLTRKMRMPKPESKSVTIQAPVAETTVTFFKPDPIAPEIPTEDTPKKKRVRVDGMYKWVGTVAGDRKVIVQAIATLIADGHDVTHAYNLRVIPGYKGLPGQVEKRLGEPLKVVWPKLVKEAMNSMM